MRVFHLRRPSNADLARVVERQARLPFAYPEVGATRAGVAPPGYRTNGNRGQLGHGGECFTRGVAALRGWAMYRTGWTEVFPPGAPVEPDTTLATLARHFGLWSVNAVRVVYVEEEARRFRFAIGTLPQHAERGEERFTLEWRDDDEVWFEVFAFLRVHHPLARLGFPLAALTLRRFARTSLRAVRAATVGLPR